MRKIVPFPIQAPCSILGESGHSWAYHSSRILLNLTVSSGIMSGQQVPAWKRLGLKLKQPTGSDPVIGSPTVGHPSSAGHDQPNKRKFDAPPPAHAPYASKKPRTDAKGTPLKKQKSVTFGDTPTKKDISSSGTPNKPAQQKPAKGTPKKQAPTTTDIQPALDYLRQWKSSRANWKFNKNHQSSLIKHLFDADAIPAADIDTFYQYIQDLKGFVRTRLKESAMEIRNTDEKMGSAGFPEGTMDVDAKQSTYQSVLAELLQKQQGNKRKSFHEVEYVATSQDGSLIIRRVVKRMRAEIVLEDLSDSEETETTTTMSSSETLTASDNAADEMVVERPAKPEGSNRRRRKLRVSNVDDSSSSESDSESDSETSSSSSSEDSDSDEDDEMEGVAAGGDDTSSSSSSSSSSSEDESDSDEDSEVEDA
ncbi:hypothetical protein HJFPF1_01947 [Paramyrothecium foliicola]|nr:hypothetical protein HJFPF1_01947 [Paramyrothecium foliicola]